MIKGRIIKDNPQIDDVLRKTNGGYDIFRYYLGNVGRIMNRPWGKKEKNLSWGIFLKAGDVWFYKDQATEETGNAVHFVQKYFNLSFVDALNKISWDFGFGGIEKNVNPVIISWDKPDVEKDYMEIGIKETPFTKRHHEFWNLLEVTEDHCKKYDCFAVKSIAINKKRVNIKTGEIVFAYYSPEERGYKLYFPDRPKDKRFKNNVSGHYLWNYNNIKECDNLIIQKSNKDLLVTTMITPCVISTQNESVGIFDKEMVDKINKVTKTPWVWYGSDPDGVQKCIKITGTNKWKYINTERDYLPEVNDASAYVKMWNLQKMGTGLKKLEELMKIKGLL